MYYKLSHPLMILAVMTTTIGCAHRQEATVLPQGNGAFEVIGLASSERAALQRAQAEASYTCEHDQKQLSVLESKTTYQGVDKQKDVSGGEVALAIFTGHSSHERTDSDYRVSLKIKCI